MPSKSAEALEALISYNPIGDVGEIIEKGYLKKLDQLHDTFNGAIISRLFNR